MFKNKFVLPVLAAIAGVEASAFTVPHNSGQPYDTADYWYTYKGDQNPTARTRDSNYIDPQLDSFNCAGTVNECAVLAKVTLDALGNPPEHPDFTGASFTITGIPQVGGPIQGNNLKP